MKYDVKYSSSDDDFTGPEGVFAAAKEGACHWCGGSTIWLDASIGKHLCSETCSRSAWADYWKSEREAARKAELLYALTGDTLFASGDLEYLRMGEQVATPAR